MSETSTISPASSRPGPGNGRTWTSGRRASSAGCTGSPDTSPSSCASSTGGLASARATSTCSPRSAAPAPYERAPGELAAHTMVTTGAMTKRIDRLERDGLVTRRPSAIDGRGRVVALTGPAGSDRPGVRRAHAQRTPARRPSYAGAGGPTGFAAHHLARPLRDSATDRSRGRPARVLTAATMPAPSVLAGRAPVEVAAGQFGPGDCGAAGVAGLAGAAVDVHLTAVPVDPRRPAHRLRQVLGMHGVDSARRPPRSSAAADPPRARPRPPGSAAGPASSARSPARNNASVTKIRPVPATIDWSSSSAARAARAAADPGVRPSGSASARSGSAPSRSRRAATSVGASNSQAVGPRRSSQYRSPVSRSRTWPTGSGGFPSPSVNLP